MAWEVSSKKTCFDYFDRFLQSIVLLEEARFPVSTAECGFSTRVLGRNADGRWMITGRSYLSMGERLVDSERIL